VEVEEYIQEEFKVEVVTDPVTGRVLTELWYDQSGQLNRPGGLPAYVEYDPDTGKVWKQRWHNGEGSHRRADYRNPSELIVDPRTDVVRSESYTDRLGRYHRDNGLPAYIRRDEQGKVLAEEYYQAGHLHRDPSIGPAVFELDCKTGVVEREEYWVHGEQVHPPQASIEPVL